MPTIRAVKKLQPVKNCRQLKTAGNSKLQTIKKQRAIKSSGQ
jgi:hypothetical protein